MKKKNYGIILSIIAVITLITVSFAFFNYNKESETETQIIAGSIYLEANDLGDIKLNKMYPMSDEDGIENGAKLELNIRGHNESEKDLYYGIYLNQGEDQEGKIRLQDDEIKVYLTKTENEETTVVYGPGTLKDFNDKLIHANVINQKTNRDDEVEIDYELTVWIDEKVLISDTITEMEGKRIYTQEEFANSYATVVPTVKGDFKEKDVNLETNAVGTLLTSGKTYEINESYIDTLFTDENVKVTISSEKEVSKFVITNAVTNEVIEKEPTLVEGKSVLEIEYTESGSYVYYGVYEDGTTSEIDTYNIKIDKEIPSFVMADGETVNVENSESYYTIENELTEIDETNEYTIMYALVEKGKEVSEYNKVELGEDNKIVVNAKSGLWDLVVKIEDEAGKEKIEKATYTISYTAEFVNNNENITLERTTQKLVLGQTYNYIEKLPTINDEDFIGYATDSKGINLIEEDTIVGMNIQKIYVIYESVGLIVKPTNSYCETVTYNGASQVLTKDAQDGMTFSGNSGINVGSYTITASLEEGYTWDDESTEDVTFTCSITYKTYTVTLNNQSATSAGTATLYGRYANGIYLDSSYSKAMTTSANAITVPTKTGYTFGGYYTSTNGGGTQLINASGNITSSFTNTLYSSNVTLYAKWTAIIYTVTYNGNKFNLPTASLNMGGVTFSYDWTTSYLTINGTISTSTTFPLMSMNDTFTANDQYKTTLTYLSGSYTSSSTVSFVTDILNSSSTSLNNSASLVLPNSGSATSTLTVSSTSASSGAYYKNYISVASTSGVTFTNYKVKVNTTLVDLKYVTYGSTYGILGKTPTKSGFTFVGWYTAESGGTEVTETTVVDKTVNHTLYAQWKKGIIITAASASKLYDGTPLVNQSVSVSSPGGGSPFLTGHSLKSVSITGSQTSVGSSSNTVNSVVIVDSSGNDVTYMYEVIKVNGILTVKQNTCEWIQVSSSTPTSCTATTQPSSPAAGDTYTYCSDKQYGYWRYKFSTITCANGTTISGQTSGYSYSTSNLAGTNCQSAWQSASNACYTAGSSSTGGVSCTTEQLTYYQMITYEYQCES